MATPFTWQNRITRYGDEAPDQLLAHPLNFRVHPKPQQDALAGVLTEVGIVQNIIYNERTKRLVDGHLRVELARKQNQPTVPVTYVDLSPEEEALILATLDPISAMAGSDADKLRQLLDDVSTGDAAVMAMLSELAEDAGVIDFGGTEGLTDPDDVPEPPADPITQPGDLWHLGAHTLLCGDSTNEADVRRVLDVAKPSMVFADPPYGIEIVSGKSVGGAKPFGSRATRGTVGASNIIAAGQYEPVIGDDSTDTAIAAYTVAASLMPKATQVWWGGNYYANALPPSSCWLVWDKERTGNFADAELAWTNQPTAVRIFRHMWNGLIKESERNEKRVHPTQKPVALAEWVFNEYGKPGDFVFDPFAGSGITIIAGERLLRPVRAIEMSPAYCDVIIARWEAMTGKTATRATDAMAAD